MATKEFKLKLTTALRPILDHRIRIIRTIVQFIMFGLLNGLIFGLGRIAFILPVEFPTGGPFSTVWNAFEALQYAITWWMFPYMAISIFILLEPSLVKQPVVGFAPLVSSKIYSDLFQVRKGKYPDLPIIV